MSKRFEARLASLPQQPREITNGSITAPSSRERNASKLLPLTATEEFRTGNEGLFAAVRGELSQVYRKKPEVIQLPNDPEQVVTITIASGNSKKTDDLLQQISNHTLNVIRIPEADEWHTKDPVVDATSKATDAEDYLQNKMAEGDVRREVRNRPHLIIANDALNAIPVITNHPITQMPMISFERMGKPKSEHTEDSVESVRRMFQNMADLAEKHHWKSVPYLIELATAIHNPLDPDNNGVSLQRSAVFLSVDGLRHLATDKFDDYLAAVKEQAGKANGKADVTEIAGGLEFLVLDKMGMVEFVSGTAKEIETAGFPPIQRQDAKDHAYDLALGTSDKKLLQEYFAGKSN